MGDPVRPYLHRWYILPRNPLLNVYLHRFLRDDDDTFHDHPWASLSILLRGEYLEVMPMGDFGKVKRLRSWKWFFRGLAALPIIYRPAEAPHWIELPSYRSAWTLFITGPRIRDWGFWCPGGRWVPWQEFTSKSEGGSEVGKGCGEA